VTLRRSLEPQEPVKAKRPPSAYNKYISKEVPKYMQENPEASRTDAFRAVAAKWKEDPSNPKNAPKTPGAESEAGDDIDAEAAKEQEGANVEGAGSAAASAATTAATTEAAAEAEQQSTIVDPEATTVDTA
jgi:hypothetical protein